MSRVCQKHERAMVDREGRAICLVCEGEKARAEQVSEQRRAAGKKGGPARAAALSPERRREISRLANEARWGKRP